MEPDRIAELRLSYCYASPSVFAKDKHILTVQVERADGTAVGGFAIDVEPEVAQFVASSLAERDRLAAEVADWREQHRRVMDEDCPSDERHCTCVPVLRAENAALRARVDTLTAAIEWYGVHLPKCAARAHEDSACTCGLDAVLSGGKEPGC